MHILASLLAPTSEYLITRYMDSKIGQQFLGSGCLFLHKKNFFYLESVLMIYLKSLWDRDKYGSCFPIGWGIGGCHIRSATETKFTLAMDGGVLMILLRWYIRSRSI